MNNDFSPYTEASVPFDENYEGFRSRLLVSSSTGHMQFDPIPSSEFLLKYYNSDFSDGGNETYNLEKQYNPGVAHVAEELDQFTREWNGNKPITSTHDFGCAFGNLVYAFLNRGLKATGTEPNVNWVNAGNTYCKGALSYQPLDKALAGLDHKIDLFTSFHVFEHLPDPVWAFNVMKEHLSPDGIINVTVPNGTSMKSLVAGLRDPHIYSFPMHLHYFSPKSIVQAVRDAGLEPIYVGTNWLPDFLEPDAQVFDRLLNRHIEDNVVDREAWRKAMCLNLLGGELQIMATHPENKAAKRMPEIDLKVERAHRFANSKPLVRMPKAFRSVPRGGWGRISAALRVLALVCFESGLIGAARKFTATWRSGGLRALKAKMAEAYLRL